MPDVTPFLWFDDQAEDAAGRYVAIFGGAVRSRGAGVRFDILGREYVAFNGGPHFRLTPTFSLMVTVQTQAEVDRYWEALLEGGGEPSQCGWLVDRFGLSWQIVPDCLGDLLGSDDEEKSGRRREAMLGMVKLDIAALQRELRGRHRARVAVERGAAAGDSDRKDVVVDAVGEFGRGTGDAVARVELRDGDRVAVDVAAAVDREPVERDPDQVRGAAAAVDLRDEARRDAVVMPQVAAGDGVGCELQLSMNDAVFVTPPEVNV
jgi:predicted 3-demethylubiquinone-9 3-methyltransferase (glyoxalase superfamily)